jgi:antitoxin (DNA-binding transcriptional repressor) of toxin-antitoxin stability system
VVVSKYGKPYAKLVPLGPVDKVPLGFLQGTVEDAFFEPLPGEVGFENPHAPFL